MKHLLIIATALLLLTSANPVKAQSFTVGADTTVVRMPASFYSDSIYTGSTPVTYEWHVTACDFPADWLLASGMCDNLLCYSISTLWPSSSTHTTNAYSAFDTGVLKLSLDRFSMTSSGCYYITAALQNASVPADAGVETFKVCFSPASLQTSVAKVGIAPVIYPNPVHDELTVSFDATKDVNSIKITDVTGRVVILEEYNSGSVKLNTHNLSIGTYLLSGYHNGVIVNTCSFIKE